MTTIKRTLRSVPMRNVFGRMFMLITLQTVTKKSEMLFVRGMCFSNARMLWPPYLYI